MDRNYRVDFYKKDNGSYPAEEYINSLDDKMAAKVYWTLGLLEKYGIELREPYSKSVGEGIFELRIKVSTNIARVLYFFYVNKRIVATHGFTKKTQKTPQPEIEKAKAYRKEFLKREAHSNENS